MSPAEYEAKHPIQVVAHRTGLSVDVIRAWERRYKAVTPQRSANSRRLYSDTDVARLLLLRRATKMGRRIGDVAHIPSEELTDLVGEDEEAADRVRRPDIERFDNCASGQHLQACLTAVEKFAPAELEYALNDAAIHLSVPVLLDDVVTQLMQEIGLRWRKGTLRISHEHFATAVVRSFLEDIKCASSSKKVGPSLIVTTPVGQVHELGSLIAAVTAAAGGWNVIYLGPSSPNEEIVFSAREQRASVIALGISHPPDDPTLQVELRRLGRQLPSNTALLVGGTAAIGYKRVLMDIGAQLFESIAKFREELDRRRALLVSR